MQSTLSMRENRCRHVLRKNYLRLEKSRCRDERQMEFKKYRIAKNYGNHIIVGASQCAYELSLEDVERYIEQRFRTKAGAANVA